MLAGRAPGLRSRSAGLHEETAEMQLECAADERDLSSRSGRHLRAGSTEHIEMTNLCERGDVRRPGTVDDMLVSTSFSLWLRRTL